MASASRARDQNTVTIKKYANRRLYNTATSSYVTLEHLCDMVKQGIDFAVYDAKSGEDITRSVLTQIIVEEEGKGEHLLPISFLRQLIGFYGDNMKRMMLPSYLEASMHAFTANQERMQEYFKGTFGEMFPFGNIEEVGRQNIAMLERSMQLFNPFLAGGAAGDDGAEDGAAAGDAAGEVEALQRRIKEMQAELDALTRDKG